MMKRATHHRAFTLIELLVVMAIIACLVSLLMPSIAQVRAKADNLRCVSNMRQIGISFNLYVSEHSQRAPVIEPWPGQPVYSPSDGAQTILQALGPYGVTNAILQCPSDLKGPNYYAKEGASYQWFPMANGQNTEAVKTLWMNNQNQTMTMSRLFLAFDYSAVHSGGSNVLYGDGHVAADNASLGQSLGPPGN
jgi:prepilin-type N-terminal cleavage/methylation domain-containing protein/prepilin-type processing-associated H-X9-DG protein